MQAVPQKAFVPWRFRQQAAPPVDALQIGTYGWLQVHLVRRTVIQRLRTLAMSNLAPPVIVSVPSSFIAVPPRMFLQAVNRASTT